MLETRVMIRSFAIMLKIPNLALLKARFEPFAKTAFPLSYFFMINRGRPLVDLIYLKKIRN